MPATAPTTSPRFTVPGLGDDAARETAGILQDRLVSLIDLTLTLKHIHWNVVGPTFISVHEMLDPQYKGVAEMVDEMAERIATLGAEPNGLPGYLVQNRRWEEYAHGRGQVPVHLRALDLVYDGVIQDHRNALERIGDLDPMSEDLLVGHTRQLEMYQWFVRAHLESSDGALERDTGASGPAPASKRAPGGGKAATPSSSAAKSNAKVGGRASTRKATASAGNGRKR
jgi:starvation-inducible DNA-binding protein